MPNSKFMTVENAIEIVMELANMGYEADTLALIGREGDDGSTFRRTTESMKEKQKVALCTIEDFFTNVVFKDDE